MGCTRPSASGSVHLVVDGNKWELDTARTPEYDNGLVLG